jgi:hypothetical protein
VEVRSTRRGEEAQSLKKRAMRALGPNKWILNHWLGPRRLCRTNDRVPQTRDWHRVPIAQWPVRLGNTPSRFPTYGYKSIAER